MNKLVAVIALLPAVCTAASVVRTLDAPDTNISGLAWGEGSLWALDESSCYAYELDPETGEVQESFYVEHSVCSSYDPGGLAYSDDILFSSFHYSTSSSYIIFTSPTGSYLGYDCLC